MSSFRQSIRKVFRPTWKLLISLKFAVIVMILITIGMIVATVLESTYDTPTSQYFVYRSGWFLGVLVLFGVNILCVALSRLPWQMRHIPFLLAHLGILIILYGSWLTFQFGIDGSMSVSEGTEESVVELNDPQLLIADQSQVKTIPIGWRPPFIDFEAVKVSDYGIAVTKWITHADPDLKFIPDEAPLRKDDESTKTGMLEAQANPAVHLKILGGPKSPPFMRRGQDLWLWSGEMGWSLKQLGPAVLQIVQSEKAPFPEQRPALQIRFDAQKKILFWLAKGSDGSEKKGQLADFQNWSEESPASIDPGWKNDVRVNFFSIIPRAIAKVTYVESNLQYGQGTPESAIFIEPLPVSGKALVGGINEGIWLGMGEKARFQFEGKSLQIGYFPKRLVLPFAIALNRFQIDHYQGTMNPMAFSSNVSVREGTNGPNAVPPTSWIRMNEPLKHGGYTFYQASYVPDQPRPTVSIFSVNQDPGRWVKYLGSILLVLGAILFFFQKLKNQRAREAASPKGESS
jgi:hypothetical protein